jgi:Pyruvate/2-oxoacid:ferredoxin oxidoreductase delta subunit
MGYYPASPIGSGETCAYNAPCPAGLASGMCHTQEQQVAAPPSILYCHCAYAEILPADRKQAVLEGLAKSGARFQAVADLCELAATRNPALKQLTESAGPIHVIACHGRAVRWLFDAAGSPLPASAVIHNMRTEDAATILAIVNGAVRSGPPCEDEQPAALPNFPAKEDGEWIPWFPVIDYDRCADCRQCAEFCLFGTYTTDAGGKVRVVHPEKCKTNCPACARVCPHSAIIFPKFSDGPISGDDGRLAASAEGDLVGGMAGLPKDQVMALLRRRNAARARAAAGGSTQEPPAR